MDRLPVAAIALLWAAAIVIVWRRRVTIEIGKELKWLPTLLLYLAVTALMFALGYHFFAYFLAALPPMVVLYAALLYVTKFRGTNRVNEMLSRGEVGAAFTEITRLIEQKGERADRLNMLGLAHQARNEWKEAADAFEHAERLSRKGELPPKKPDDPYEEAVQAFEEIEPLQGEAAIYRANRAMAVWKSGRPEEARPLLEQARLDLPSEAVLASNLAQLYVDLDRLDDARRELAEAERLLREHPLGAGDQQRMEEELERCRKEVEEATT